MTTTKKPSKAAIGRIAERSPHLLNPLVAFFVMGWERVFISTCPMHGIDQAGKARLLPDYAGMLGIDACVHYLLAAPPERTGGNDMLSTWAESVAAG
jgi:hypothetical protein